MTLGVLTVAPQDLLDMGLDDVVRDRPDPSAGAPRESFKRLSENASSVSGVWECTPGRFPVKRDGSHSMMYIVSGTGRIIDADGTAHEIRPGSVHIEPDQWEGEWEITTTVRKFYVITRS